MYITRTSAHYDWCIFCALEILLLTYLLNVDSVDSEMQIIRHLYVLQHVIKTQVTCHLHLTCIIIINQSVIIINHHHQSSSAINHHQSPIINHHQSSSIINHHHRRSSSSSPSRELKSSAVSYD